MNLELRSTAPVEQRKAVEGLLFFNPSQGQVRDGIVAALETFGMPRVVEQGSSLTILTGSHQPQTLFAYDADRPASPPIGVILFLRTSPTDVTILHVAVRPEYTLQGRREGTGVGLFLVESVRTLCTRISGVTRLIFTYGGRSVLSVPQRTPSSGSG
ncbi:MAG: hypothetical protein IAE82_03530 [Opitutaceae bacterium]|nr:hypothetical protein [Opitutaceae bacterium]